MNSLVTEVACASEDEHNAVLICRSNDFLITHTAPGSTTTCTPAVANMSSPSRKGKMHRLPLPRQWPGYLHVHMPTELRRDGFAGHHQCPLLHCFVSPQWHSSSPQHIPSTQRWPAAAVLVMAERYLPQSMLQGHHSRHQGFALKLHHHTAQLILGKLRGTSTHDAEIFLTLQNV